MKIPAIFRSQKVSLPFRSTTLSLLILTAVGLAAQSTPPTLVSYVDPMIGTANDGNIYPGSTVPFGMIQWSPDTSQNFYYYGDKAIRGFSATHLSGAGCPLFADMPILPLSDRPSPQRDLEHPETAAFDHKNEIAQPGYYSVVLADGTRVELTTLDRTGIARLTYPKGKRAGLLVNGPGSASADVHMAILPPIGREHDAESITTNPDGTLTASITAGGFCGSPTKYTIHVAYQFKSKPNSTALWQNGVLLENSTKSTKASGKRAAAWVDLGAQSTQIVKVGLSYVSEENAIANITAEIPGWNFDAVRKSAQDRWEKALSKVKVEGGTDAQRKIFYTGVYHELIGQTLFSDVNGEYPGMDGKVYKIKASQKGQYTNVSDWDIYRNTVQFQALLFPQEAADLAQSLVNFGEQLGSYPRWVAANDGTYVMGGDSPPIILASIYAFGAKNFDAKTALNIALKVADTPGLGEHNRPERVMLAENLKLGYIPSTDEISVSEMLETASADFSIAQLAKAQGDNSSYERMLKRAGTWRNLMDPETRWMRPRAADGTWQPGFDAEKSLPKRQNAPLSTDQAGFEEGNTYQYTFMLPFDYRGLFDAIGDNAVVEKRLDKFFTKLVCWGEPCFNMANEPDFVTPYAYTFLGKPFKTASVIDRVEKETFNTTPGGIPGNDDLGATSGVYIWNALGMYPAIPGMGGVVLGTPMFQKSIVQLGSGGTLTITRSGSGIYVQSVTLNGKPHPSSWLPLTELSASDNHLAFTMGESPSTWATATGDRPPSVTAAK